MPRGYLDTATCTTVGGWTELEATPSDTLFADVYYNGAAGASGATGIRLTAGNDRADLCTALGSCDHGFSMPTPRGVMDGAAHDVYAYGINPVSSGANTLLSDAPRSVTCAAPTIPAGDVKRHVTSPTILNDWAFDTFTDMAPYDTAAIAAVPDGVDLGQPPDVVQVSGDPAVYVIDGTHHRHVTDPTSFAAWRFTSAEIKPITATDLATTTNGPDWPAAPLLIKDPTDPSVYMLDVPFPATATADAGADDAGVAETDGGSTALEDGGVVTAPSPIADAGHVSSHDHDARAKDDDAGTHATGDAGDEAPGVGSAGGCAVTRVPSDGGNAWVTVVVLGALAFVRRRGA